MDQPGYGFIQTMRVRDGRIPFLPRHLEHSLSELALPKQRGPKPRCSASCRSRRLTARRPPRNRTLPEATTHHCGARSPRACSTAPHATTLVATPCNCTAIRYETHGGGLDAARRLWPGKCDGLSAV